MSRRGGGGGQIIRLNMYIERKIKIGGQEEYQNNSKINLSEFNRCGVHWLYMCSTGDMELFRETSIFLTYCTSLKQCMYVCVFNKQEIR